MRNPITLPKESWANPWVSRQPARVRGSFEARRQTDQRLAVILLLACVGAVTVLVLVGAGAWWLLSGLLQLLAQEGF